MGLGGSPRIGGRAGRGLAVARWTSRIRTELPLAVLDAALAAAAYLVALLLRFEGAVPDKYWSRFSWFLPLAVLLHLASNVVGGLYGEVWRHASVAEARRVLLAGASAMFALLCLFLFAPLPRTPVSVVVLGAVLATLLAALVRFQSRLFAFRRTGGRGAGLRIAVIGAGQAGAAIVREMLRNPQAGLTPVALFDDDPRKHGRAIVGVPVVGAINDLPPRAPSLRIHQALLAIPSADSQLTKRAAAAAEAAELPLKVVPGMKELVGSSPSVRDVRDLQIEDLIGRQQVEVDVEAVGELLTGRTVLITGAGGSIGSEIARQVSGCRPGRLVLLDHDETHLHDASAQIDGPVEPVLVDVRDAHRVTALFDRHRPDVVFHAAAHKHVPLLELHASEAVRTNVLGTLNVLDAAARVGVDHLVLLSSDKAVAPTSVMGISKWLSEQLLLARAPATARWCAVRFGNVLGSRGSVVPTFARQIAAGGPVTVTDPRMTRYFMSVDEAVRLVLQAASLARGSDVFVLEMGEPVNILAMAERMIRLAGRTVGSEIEVRIVGARPGEKLTEQLHAADERTEPTPHPSVLRIKPRRLGRGQLEIALAGLAALVEAGRDDDVKRALAELPAAVGGRRTQDATIDLRDPSHLELGSSPAL